ncbi:BMP family lipoprotein [Candidatus Halobonum tyrrellensis]|uniref:Putative sugar ABC transporter periplasmic substrate-binding protein n=1 Tax=Candidatus Halobonum tyrrellensis G22 TaxID=1324957 RepID=V4HJ71_9EURY|nr:BMP family protein [Candidatus Halobonum tyrrellensis]ESP89798.1 putative sugar ABC transporter periplasmic substrate-binding protein [Candidatus Halobonum tyrrellensis G22]
MTRDTDARGDGTDGRTTAVDRRAVLRSGLVLATGGSLAGCLTGDDDGDVATTDGGGTDTTTEGDGTDTTDGESTETDGTTGSASDETVDVAIVSSPAGFGDGAFNDLALEGLETAAEEYDVRIQEVEETNQSNYGTVQSRLAESGNPDYDLIVMVGYQHTQALESNAADYPDQYWMLINDYVDQPNVAGYTWANHEMSYQAGVVAGTMTSREFSHEGNATEPDSATVGFVGGVDGALINAFERAYVAGAEYVNEDVDVRVGYIGNYTDTQTANNIASSQYDAGADIVYQAAAAAGQGVFQAAQNADRFAIGVDADQSTTLPDYQDVIMASAVKLINEGTREVALAVAEDDWSSVQGQNVVGLEEDAVSVVLGQAIGPELPDEVTQNLQETKEAIIDGEITVPCTASGCQD